MPPHDPPPARPLPDPRRPPEDGRLLARGGDGRHVHAEPGDRRDPLAADRGGGGAAHGGAGPGAAGPSGAGVGAEPGLSRG
ncbi:hypothetical protein STTU_2966 [Streptomyces sp. Tu6071]|nr:hypothetical protein STTU_2966 [Streptomyces sp. Tu6071]